MKPKLDAVTERIELETYFNHLLADAREDFQQTVEAYRRSPGRAANAREKNFGGSKRCFAEAGSGSGGRSGGAEQYSIRTAMIRTNIFRLAEASRRRVTLAAEERQPKPEKRKGIQMIQYYGYKNGKYQIFETESGVKLDFQGADANKFEQVNPPKNARETVVFSLTLKWLADTGFLATEDRVWQSVERTDGTFEIVSLPRETFDKLARTVWERLAAEAKANGGRITEDFTLGYFDTKEEAAVAVSLCDRALALNQLTTEAQSAN